LSLNYWPIFYWLLVIGYWLVYRLGKVTPLMLSVGVAALLTCYLRNINISTLGCGWGEWKYQRMSFLITNIQKWALDLHGHFN
jgi:hypothetical protein